MGFAAGRRETLRKDVKEDQLTLEMLAKFYYCCCPCLHIKKADTVCGFNTNLSYRCSEFNGKSFFLLLFQ